MRGIGLASRIAEHFGVFIAPSSRTGLDPWADLSHIKPMTSFRTIFDVGAHHGETVIKLRRRATTAHIHAFEPFPESFAHLRNVLKDMQRVSCWQTAVADRKGDARLHLQGTDYEFSLIPAKAAANVKSIAVSLTTLDDFANEHGITHVDLLKTDTEGADLDVLKGATNLLKRGAIDTVYAEFGIDESDKQHTSLSSLTGFLAPYQFQLLGLYEIYHFPNPWRLGFGNALFTRLGASPGE